MLEPGQDLPLPPEAVTDRLADERRRADLDRHALGKDVVGALRFEHRSHAAFRDAADDAVGPDVVPFERLFPGCHAEQMSGRLAV